MIAADLLADSGFRSSAVDVALVTGAFSLVGLALSVVLDRFGPRRRSKGEPDDDEPDSTETLIAVLRDRAATAESDLAKCRESLDVGMSVSRKKLRACERHVQHYRERLIRLGQDPDADPIPDNAQT